MVTEVHQQNLGTETILEQGLTVLKLVFVEVLFSCGRRQLDSKNTLLLLQQLPQTPAFNTGHEEDLEREELRAEVFTKTCQLKYHMEKFRCLSE